MCRHLDTDSQYSPVKPDRHSQRKPKSLFMDEPVLMHVAPFSQMSGASAQLSGSQRLQYIIGQNIEKYKIIPQNLSFSINYLYQIKINFKY
ncbi:hypothetical protein BpHYR1_014801 [Brachionus plicatilis]|uniref:Uncharacterized protein n=1 Tax=Brachionus plicatilis TaxID=10195 RepID=A0A3M7SSV7_BRAPC|nr:hypothetical protein BpHYR1_014801 [Brachionus plicatilis]